MNYASTTKARLVQLLEIKDNELDKYMEGYEEQLDEYDGLKEQQLILFWLLFITAGIGFMF